jgi:protein involved in polysaccharide export with SLBB domain
MKKFIFILAATYTISATSQSLDESFLNSLPQDMQDDILSESIKNKTSEEPVYRSITSQTKIEKANLEALKNRLEADLEYLKNQLEENNELPKPNDLILFGSDFFRNYQSTYMPINEPNLNPDYVLDYGDILGIQIIGQLDTDEDLMINRDGSINLPDIGKVQIAGLSLSDASSLIKAKVKSAFIGSETFISLAGLRDINVLVSGNAFKPGVYTVSGNANLLHVLAIAGGINEYGSYRQIDLIRNQEIVDTLDMYDVLITGSYNNTKMQLKSGDIIFVRPVKNIVSVDGAVKISAKYELFENQDLYDSIEYANGISKDADLRNIFLDRILDGKIKSLSIQNIKQFKNIIANDGDKVFIRKHSFRSVEVNGAVLKPGKYLMAEGESLNELIKKAGGYTENAYPFGAIYENREALAINKMAKDILYEDFIDNIITVSQKNPTGNFDLTAVIDLTKNLKGVKPNGRIVVDLLNEFSSSDLVIRNGDKLTIPETTDNIYIYGEVSYEGAIKFKSSQSLKYYIKKSGGFKENADHKAVYVLHPNGDTQRSTIKKSLFQNSPDNELVLYPGSVIFVPRAIENSASNRLAAQAYVSILGNIGIALASLSSINNN